MKIISLLLSFSIALWMVGLSSAVSVFVIIFYTFWLSIPLYVAKRRHLKDSIIIYVFWVIIQIILFKGRFFLPPQNVGIPYN
ncbi:MAG: hypothetical protein AAB521_01330 [Patescibacteria group bacterium]